MIVYLTCDSRMVRRTLVTLVAVLSCSFAATAFGQPFPSVQLEFFEKEVRPLFAKHCYKCHSVNAKRLEGGLLLDSRSAQLRGGDSGPSIVPGNADQSLLVQAVRYEDFEMPPKGKLPERETEILVRWVEMGAPWPEELPPVEEGEKQGFDLEKRRSEFWVWQPVTAPNRPSVKNSAWPNNEIDYYILAGLEKSGLKPAKEADRTALLRRLYFDLIGLPPSPEEIASFVANKDSNAVDRVVDGLLNSPHFGERWGRHWLDLMRYAESRGHEFDNDTPNAFQYRDYVIRAFNADVPYDQFVREHIAGDLLANPRLHPTRKFNESILGTGFWFLGEWVHSPVDIRKDESDRFDNMLDVMSKSFLGVTLACARCHDHKFDAISTADYYSLSGFLQSSDYRQVRFESLEQNRKVAQQMADLEETYQGEVLKLLESEGIHQPPQSNPLADERVLVDYAQVNADEYWQDGFIFGASPRKQGSFYLDVDLDSDSAPRVKVATFGAAVSDPIWAGLESVTGGSVHDRNSLDKLPKSGRTLRTPTFELRHGKVSCLVEGRGHIVACVDSHRLIAGPLHGQTIKAIGDKPGWVTLNLDRYLGHRLHLEFVPARESDLVVRLVVEGLNPAELAAMQRRLKEDSKAFREYAVVAQAYLNGETDPLRKVALEASEEGGENTAERPEKVEQVVQKWMRERQQLGAQIVRKSYLAPAIMDGTGEDDRVLIRGNASKPGDVERRHFLTAISGDSPMMIQRGSGRLELAEHINDPANPLTARVIVNRLWHHLMGRGIVPTVDDFGFLGERPTHPELLDHLASRFVADGRRIKSLIKYIVLSRTYQMSSHTSPSAMDKDPKNRRWHYQPPRRLQGEVIRDALLGLSGRLDTALFGPPVPIHLTPFMDGRGRPGKSGPLDGDGRRSVYIAVRRNFLSPFMLTFDTPAPFSTMGRRNVSNVPAQSLILLNDPLVVQLARGWGERALKSVPRSGEGNTEERVRWMYLTGFGRPPSVEEAHAAVTFLRSNAAKRKVVMEDVDLWADFAHVLVNTKEFIFLR